MIVETIAAVVAAVAAATSLYYARDTVREAVGGREDAKTQHEEQIAQMRSATQAAAEQHRVEMEDRRRVAEADMLERQLRQLGAVTDMVREVGTVARSDPRLQQDSEAAVAGNAHIPSMLIALSSALAVLAKFGVPLPPATDELARVGRSGGVAVQWVTGQSVGALLELQQLNMDVLSGQAGAA